MTMKKIIYIAALLLYSLVATANGELYSVDLSKNPQVMHIDHNAQKVTMEVVSGGKATSETIVMKERIILPNIPGPMSLTIC